MRSGMPTWIETCSQSSQPRREDGDRQAPLSHNGEPASVRDDLVAALASLILTVDGQRLNG